MQNLYVSEISLRVDSNLLEDFYKTAKYITKTQKTCASYDKSAPFKYLLNTFNDEFDEYPRAYWLNVIGEYNSKMKKDKRISVWIMNKTYRTFNKNCSRLKINRSTVIRSLMLKLIEETPIIE